MITLARFKSAVLESKTRILKVFQYGAKTANECAPFGDDSSPVANMTAIYAETAEIGEPVIIGYINTRQLAAPGEKRLYSLKPDKSQSSFIWLKNNGTMELAGSTHNLVRYAPLSSALTSHNAQVNAELAKIAAAIAVLGGSYAPGAVSVDITASKINEIKTI